MSQVESYSISTEKLKSTVKIMKIRGNLSYNLKIPEIGIATMALLNNVKSDLVTEMHVSDTEILDSKIISTLKKQFRKRAISLINQKMPGLDSQTLSTLAAILMNDMLGLGNIEFLLNDPHLEEVIINSSKEPIRVFHKKYGWLLTNITIDKEEDIINYSNIIARRVGRQITTLNPLLDAHLVTGDRANAVLYPISTKGNTIIIRKFARDPWTMVDFMKNKTSNSFIFANIWLAMQYEANMLVSGGTGSGKTSFLNVCMPFIPPNHRILSIEDTRELNLPDYLYWSPLTTRKPNPEGRGEVSMLDLLINALRMRPDRIILGEMRKREQAEVLFEAMHTGHSVYATLHAESINETISRLINPPLEVPANLLNAVHLNVVMFRDRRRGIRRIYQVGEFIPFIEEGRANVKPNIIFRWKPESDNIVQHSQSLRLFEDLSRHTGLTLKEIDQDIQVKKTILDWMTKRNFRTIDQVGGIMNKYYSDPDAVIKLATKKSKKLDF